MNTKYVILGLLVLGIIICVGVSIYLNSENEKERKNGFLIPFSGRLAPSGIWEPSANANNPGTQDKPENGIFLVGMGGGEDVDVPQIQCPEGYKINIVSAYLDIIDPYGECSHTPDPVLQRTCGYDPKDNSTAVSCGSDSTICGVGMECSKESGTCIPNKCRTNRDCITTSASMKACHSDLGKCCNTALEKKDGLICVGDPLSECPSGNVWAPIPGKNACMACIDPNTGLSPDEDGQGFCASMPTCMFVSKGLNETCRPGNSKEEDQHKCRPRDASAYLARHCNGKSVCLGSSNDMWIPNEVNGAFGPLPCQMKADSQDKHYLTLPIIGGWGGGIPSDSGSNISDKPNFSQGYMVHGIAQCLPKDYF